MDRTINEIVKKYADQVYAKYSPKAIYLYGSCARGENNQYSDIDVAVIVNPMDVNKYMDIFGRLWEIAAYVDGRIEPNLFIDDGEDDRFSMLHEVVTTGKKIEAASGTPNATPDGGRN